MSPLSEENQMGNLADCQKVKCPSLEVELYMVIEEISTVNRRWITLNINKTFLTDVFESIQKSFKQKGEKFLSFDKYMEVYHSQKPCTGGKNLMDPFEEIHSNFL